MARKSFLFRTVIGFVTGSAVGWAAHDQVDKTFWNGRSENDSAVTKVSPLSVAGKFKVLSPWDDNWDRYFISTLTVCLCSHSWLLVEIVTCLYPLVEKFCYYFITRREDQLMICLHFASNFGGKAKATAGTLTLRP